MAKNSRTIITKILPRTPTTLSIIEMLRNGMSNQRGRDSYSGTSKSLEVEFVILVSSIELSLTPFFFK